MQVVGNILKLRLIILISFFAVLHFKIEANNEGISEFECLLETGASGLFQNQRKFLKETQFFPYKTLMIFSNNFSVLKEKDNTFKKESEAGSRTENPTVSGLLGTRMDPRYMNFV